MKNLIFLILTLLAWPGGGCGTAKAGVQAAEACGQAAEANCAEAAEAPAAEAAEAPAAEAAVPDGEWAVVNTSSVFMRCEASYTAENVSQSRMGTPVQVLARTGYWVKIRTPEPYEGWVNELTLAPYPADYRSCKRYICIREHSFVYAEPSLEAARLSDLSMSDIVRAAGKEGAKAGKASGKDGASAGQDKDGWAAVQLWDGRSGWVPAADVADFEKCMAGGAGRMVKVQKQPKMNFHPGPEGGESAKTANNELSPGAPARTPEAAQTGEPGTAPAGTPGAAQTGEPGTAAAGTPGAPAGAEAIAAEIVATARLFLGSPYMWGGMSAGLFDCSGLVGFCYFMAGIQLPRDASQQIGCGVPVDFEDMQAGDLVFFGEKRVGHVALCTGSGRIIHSSQIVRENSLVPGEPDYYGRHIIGIRRIIGHLPQENFIKNSQLYF